MNQKTVEVPGISCGHCVRTIEREVAELAGVTSVAADQGTRQVTISWEESRTTWEAIRDLLTEINYPPAD
ncbi:MAG TPA: cation transporter [Longimicrobiales bacterium]|jgi:copper chaperone CopZ